MKWKFYNGSWHDESNVSGVPLGLPARNTNNGGNRAWQKGDTFDEVRVPIPTEKIERAEALIEYYRFYK